jgi:hypothetical protein
MVKEAMFWNCIVGAIVAAQFLVAWLFPKPGNPIIFTIVSFLLGGTAIYFAGAASAKFVERGSDGTLDFYHLSKSTWIMLVLFCGFWFLINNFFVMGLNASPITNISVSIGLWVVSSLIVPPVIEFVTNRSAFLQSMNPTMWVGYGGIVFFAAVLVYGQSQK